MNFFAFFNEQRQVRRTIKELSSLSDRELSDIGITRSDIRAVAKTKV
jgi:uncharacterized protein YjiS (DUF1127 family)